MPRENSFSDSDGRSLTPDLEDIPVSEPQSQPPLTHTDEPLKPSDTPVVASEPSGLTSTVSAPMTQNGPERPPVRPIFAGASSPGDKFRASVRKVMQLHRTSTMLSNRGEIGAEPGVDPRRHSAYIHYGHIRQNCVIEIADYSSVRSSFGRMGNKAFIDMLQDNKACEREPWVKVRWINIGGISWDVISALAIKYDLHPLALEDVLHQRGHARSKSDYYNQHLFLRVLCHALADENESTVDSVASSMVTLPRSSSPGPMSMGDEKGLRDYETEGTEIDDDATAYDPASRKSTARGRAGIVKKKPWGGSFAGGDVENTAGYAQKHRVTRMLAGRGNTFGRKRIQEEKTLEELKKGERVNVKISPMNIFLLRDGTVISIHSTPNLEYTTPITNRLRQRDTGLRATADPSLLVESLLDLVVDSALEVVDEYHSKIMKMEHDILLKPKMKTVRYLHILSGDLILHKRTLEPIKTLIYGLRRYDLDRCAALVDTSQLGDQVKVEGFMSHKSKIYLADVHDHMDYILTSLEMFAGISENLINYTFNMASYEMNEVMRRLTTATIIFLPLTLLTGYFGMNFESMWSVNLHSDLLFWEIALPVMAVILPIFLWSDVIRMVHYIKKKMLVSEVEKRYKID